MDKWRRGAVLITEKDDEVFIRNARTNSPNTSEKVLRQWLVMAKFNAALITNRLIDQLRER